MCSLRVESACLHYVEKKIEIVVFWGVVGLRIYLDSD